MLQFVHPFRGCQVDGLGPPHRRRQHPLLCPVAIVFVSRSCPSSPSGVVYSGSRTFLSRCSMIGVQHLLCRLPRLEVCAREVAYSPC